MTVPLFRVVLDMAPEHLAAWHPLVAPFAVLDLRKTRRNLGQRRVHASRELGLGFEHFVEQFEHLRVGHRRQRRTHPQVHDPDGGVDVLDDGGVALAGDPYLVRREPGRGLFSRILPPPRPIGAAPVPAAREVPRCIFSASRVASAPDRTHVSGEFPVQACCCTTSIPAREMRRAPRRAVRTSHPPRIGRPC